MDRKDKKSGRKNNYFSHGRGDSRWCHAEEKTQGEVLGTAVLLTLLFAFVEVIGGIYGNSLALIGDAGHMLTDSLSLFFALAANRLAVMGADRRHTFGHGRFEILAAFVNGLLMAGVVVWLLVEACRRILNPSNVSGDTVMLIAAIGLCVNLLVAWSLSRDRKNINTRAALVHVMGDMLGSLAALAAGAVIHFGGPLLVDPLLSMFVACLLVKSTWGILNESVQVLLDGIPKGIDPDEVGAALERVPGVNRVHDLHIWTMSAGHGAIQCHVHIDNPDCWPKILDAVRCVCAEKFGIDHVTVQPEWDFSEDVRGCGHCRAGLCREDSQSALQVSASVSPDSSRI